MDADKIGYLGWSWGGYMGGIIPAVEKRIKAIVLNVGGMVMNKSLPEVDQLNYLPRITQPTLMLNGKHDMFFPIETAQKPMFDLLGTPLGQKKKIVYGSGHLVPRLDFVKESMAWYDTYLGRWINDRKPYRLREVVGACGYAPLKAVAPHGYRWRCHQ